MNTLLRILLVEDNPGDVDLIRDMLRETGVVIFSVESVPRLSEALSRLKGNAIDLVLLDLGLPDSKGMDTFIRLQAETRDVPIIILTDDTDQNAAVTAVREGAQDYLIKGQISGSIITRAIRYAVERKQAELAQRESTEKYRALIETTATGYVIVDSKGCVLDANQEYVRLTGHETLVEIQGRAVTEWTAEWDLERNAREVRKCLEQGYVRNLEIDYKAKNGAVTPIEINATVLKNPLGNSILTLCRDITERKRAEEALRESEGRYRHLFENMLEGFAYCRMIYIEGGLQDFIYLSVNNAFETLTGLKNVVGEKVSDVIPGIQESDPGLLEIYSRVALTGKPERFETYVQALQMWFSISVYSPEKEFFVAVFDVITERKRAEHSLAEKEARLRLLVETIPDMIWLKDVDGRYLSCNKMFEQFIGTRESEIVGKTDYDFVVKELADFILENDNKTMAAGKPSSNVEWITFANDGHRALLNTIRTPMFDAEGKILGVLGIGRDITEYQKLEEQLRHAQKMESIGTLAGGIAHDFNNILSAIIGYGHVTLMKMPKDDPLRMNIEHILESADRAAALTQSLLAFSRKQIIDRKPVDLNNILNKVEKFLVRVIGEDVEVRMALEKTTLTLFADAGQLEQVFMNLATNARDAMPNGGSFTIESAITELDNSFVAAHGYGKTGTYALISATDTGEGMTEETRVKIFEPFFTTKEVGKGTGLGLAMVYGIIKQHEGFINVYSEPGKGTTFRIYLPLIKTEATEERPIIATEYTKGGTETVLVAEDDASVRKLTVLVLEQMGYTVIIANDGEEAVTKFMENKDKIQLLLFDIIMPKKNGREAYEEIKKTKPDIPVLFASGYSPDMLRVKELVDDDAALVYKPISPQSLLKKVREVLDRK